MKTIKNIVTGLLIIVFLFFLGALIQLGVQDISTVARGWATASEGLLVLILAIMFLLGCYLIGGAVNSIES